MDVTGIIFDLDGTLLNTLADIAAAANHALKSANLPEHETAAFGAMVGDGMAKLAERALPEDLRTPGSVEALKQSIYENLDRREHELTAPYPGIPELLEVLAQREVPIAVLSNKPHALTKAAVAHFFPEIPFDPVFGVSEAVPPKPNLNGANEILSRWGGLPGAVVYVGDTNTDMITASNAGFFAVGVTWGFRQASELVRHGARALVDEPMQLLTLI